MALHQDQVKKESNVFLSRLQTVFIFLDKKRVFYFVNSFFVTFITSMAER